MSSLDNDSFAIFDDYRRGVLDILAIFARVHFFGEISEDHFKLV